MCLHFFAARLATIFFASVSSIGHRAVLHTANKSSFVAFELYSLPGFFVLRYSLISAFVSIFLFAFGSTPFSCHSCHFAKPRNFQLSQVHATARVYLYRSGILVKEAGAVVANAGSGKLPTFARLSATPVTSAPGFFFSFFFCSSFRNCD